MRSFALKMFLATMTVAAITTAAVAQADLINFDPHVNPKFAACLGAPGGPTPTANVTVKRGKLNDTLTIEGDNIKPHLAFDMFTVQKSSLLPNGNADPAF